MSDFSYFLKTFLKTNYYMKNYFKGTQGVIDPTYFSKLYFDQNY